MLLHLFSRRRKQERATLFRNFVFGVEDSLVSTVGLLSGIAATATPRLTIITTGTILIFVEAFSMGIGAYLSEEVGVKDSTSPAARRLVTRSAVIMFVSYLVAGFIPLFPYFAAPAYGAKIWSVIFTLSTLFMLGFYTARRFRVNVVAKSLEMLVFGGLATLVGIMVSKIFHLS